MTNVALACWFALFGILSLVNTDIPKWVLGLASLIVAVVLLWSGPWRKVPVLVAALCLLGFGARAQDTNPPPNSVPGAVSNVFGFMEAGGSNWMIAPYGTASTDGKKFGGGLALAYKLNEFVAPVLRMDYFDGKVWMPSGTVQLQVPIRLGAKAMLYPLVFTGVGSPISGRTTEDSVVGIFGIGAALKLTDHFDLVGDFEKWTSFDANQIRFGFLWKF